MEELLSAHGTSGVQIQIPLLIGSMRIIDKPHERAIDMLVHTIVAEAAMKVSMHASDEYCIQS